MSLYPIMKRHLGSFYGLYQYQLKSKCSCGEFSITPYPLENASIIDFKRMSFVANIKPQKLPSTSSCTTLLPRLSGLVHLYVYDLIPFKTRMFSSGGGKIMEMSNTLGLPEQHLCLPPFFLWHICENMNNHVFKAKLVLIKRSLITPCIMLSNIFKETPKMLILLRMKQLLLIVLIRCFGTIGVVVFNDAGEILDWYSKRFAGICDPLIFEFLTMRESLL
ncbi:conserved hypothetical protein [Ricinus communis]|uniref:Uncharacterized protein n=1 Tax=Ricinus communis TaxID=3988 RepID=B9SVX7_RICCO|nr:conserved hypothetical protein [Ricinus communis]